MDALAATLMILSAVLWHTLIPTLFGIHLVARAVALFIDFNTLCPTLNIISIGGDTSPSAFDWLQPAAGAIARLVNG
jgi:hypothetical protein